MGEVVDTICDQPAVVPAAVGYHAIAKREADAEAEADPQFFAHPYAAHAVAAPLAAAPVAVAPVAAHAVAHPKIKIVPVEVEHCHTVTKVTCSYVNNEIPK